MNFARAKTILIFIFVFINIFLLLIYNFFVLEKTNVDKETLLQVLANNNISVDESLITNEKKPVPGVEVINLANDKEKLLKTLLKKNYVKKGENSYATDELSLNVEDSTVTLSVINPSDKKYKDINEINAGNMAVKTLAKYGFEKDSLNVNNVIKNPKGDFYITIAYKYEDFPVFNNNLNAFANPDGLSNVKGPVISFKKIKDEKYDISPVPDILLEFINNSDAKSTAERIIVTDIKLGYYISLNQIEVSTYAIPCYEITLKSGHIYYYDARVNVDSSFKLLGSKIEK